MSILLSSLIIAANRGFKQYSVFCLGKVILELIFWLNCKLTSEFWAAKIQFSGYSTTEWMAHKYTSYTSENFSSQKQGINSSLKAKHLKDMCNLNKTILKENV